MTQQVLRARAEQQFSHELDALKAQDSLAKPPQWQLSPKAVVDYLLGTTLADGTEISAKYIGNRRLMEIAVATLATDRALLLLGVPGTAKSWVSEHLAAAISGNSDLLIQGTAGTSEDTLRYSWNYAQLLSKGPSEAALVKSPMLRAMQEGKIARVEELTRIPADVQDTLITLLSEKNLPVPELELEYQAVQGFSVIATANNRDKGVNELSSALKRRFNTVILPPPATIAEEVEIVQKRVQSLGKSLKLPEVQPLDAQIQKLVTIFRELRHGQTLDGKQKLKTTTGTLSTAEAISVMSHGWAMAGHFGVGDITDYDLAAGLQGAILKDPVQDVVPWKEYVETVMKQREGWQDLYRACRDLE
ncbi:ATP-binding protein [Acinetobacter venetianus]|uniref:ATP-binding protein n=1 Tax=Acinetobacter venetianus TaxID=52133 RepID=UPI000778898D|nr:AAA family ATPase [Acinetobacter venetianus]KXZ66199.1 AAA domain (dynein-related subfamily) [Acinetobacter venetianus]